MAAFIGTIAFVAVSPMGMTCWMAWKTRDVDDANSESWWIFVLVLLQLELCLLGAPFIAILRNLSTDGRYVGFVIILWAFPMSTLVLIMLPKLLAFRQAQRGEGDQQPKRKRGQRANDVPISGMSTEDRTGPTHMVPYLSPGNSSAHDHSERVGVTDHRHQSDENIVDYNFHAYSMTNSEANVAPPTATPDKSHFQNNGHYLVHDGDDGKNQVVYSNDTAVDSAGGKKGENSGPDRMSASESEEHDSNDEEEKEEEASLMDSGMNYQTHRLSL